MTTGRRIEHTIEAYLSNDDSPDISNPIHSTEVAKQFGFSGALVGGVTVFGWATPAILEALGDRWLARGWAEYAFRQPTYPGDTMTIVAEEVPGSSVNAWSVTMSNQHGVECVRATVGLGDASWLGEHRTPARMTGEPAPEPRPPLVLATAPVGEDWVPMTVDASVEAAREFARDNQRTDDPRFAGERPVMHPAWIAGWAERILRHNWAVPSSMHTRSQVQHLVPVAAGQRITVGAHLREAYERRAHHFAVFDVLLSGEDGTDLARLRHTTVFRIATTEEREAAEQAERGER